MSTESSVEDLENDTILLDEMVRNIERLELIKEKERQRERERMQIIKDRERVYKMLEEYKNNVPKEDNHRLTIQDIQNNIMKITTKMNKVLNEK